MSELQHPSLTSVSNTEFFSAHDSTAAPQKSKTYFNAYTSRFSSSESLDNSLDGAGLPSTSSSDSVDIDNASPAKPGSENEVASVEDCGEEQLPSVTLPFKLTNDIHFSQEGYCINYENRSYNNIFSGENQNVSMLVGYLCLTMAAVFFISTIFSLFIAPFLQPTTHKIIEFLRTDNYYCFLVPLLAPVSALTVYANWFSMKYFKHS